MSVPTSEAFDAEVFKMRLIEAKKEYYRTLAKKDGYRSRSAYKLAQLDNSYHFLKSRSTVIDIGSSPGGWLQVAKQRVGAEALVIGIDIKHVHPLHGVITLQGSISESEVIDEALKLVNGKVDIVLSDLSPNTSGIWDLDHFRQISLTRAALLASVRVLKRDGSSVFKVFEGELLEPLKKEMKCHFRRVYTNKPKASRQRSSEQYFVCLNFTRA